FQTFLRLHPVGPRGISQGCITLNSQIGFDEFENFLRSQHGEILPGTNLKYYGVIDVSAFSE
ncbi:tlde1 domain-containing protein, partial [Pseudomonas savastanoi]|uniref:tlde1 domain-containing protein n=1 Tax=Pseudomonas savastanoi TaxID=29438 RepID=UPI000EFEA402